MMCAELSFSSRRGTDNLGLGRALTASSRSRSRGLAPPRFRQRTFGNKKGRCQADRPREEGCEGGYLREMVPWRVFQGRRLPGVNTSPARGVGASLFDIGNRCPADALEARA